MKIFLIFLVVGLVLAGCTSAPAAQAAETAKAVVDVKPAASATAAAGTGEAVAFEGFEDDAIWMAVAGTWKDGNQSTGAKIVAGHATEGSMSLECSYQFVNDPAKKGASWMTEDILKKNWTGVNAVLIDIDNTTGKALEFDLAVCTGEAWDWYETQVVAVAPGLNKNVKFHLNDVKSNVNQWAWGGTVGNLKAVQRVVVQVINGPAQGDVGKVYIDNLRLVK